MTSSPETNSGDEVIPEEKTVTFIADIFPPMWSPTDWILPNSEEALGEEF